ncbi:MAG TPA: SulP family inorganic anion transporter [Sumerlaeia bacterium]|nr:SulP family inorganic anion transporter [Sumerlaeia bacterium]
MDSGFPDAERPRRTEAALARILARYPLEHLRHDAVAGLTVAVMGVPQAMGYAMIAGLPPVYGLYTSIVCCIVAALSGSSNHLVTGPTNAICMVILSLTAHLPAKYNVDLLQVVLLLTLMTGLVQLAFGALRMGGIVRYVSNSVVVGFTAGAGVLIATNQLRNVLGIQVGGGKAERFYEVLWLTVKGIPDTNPYALSIGVFTALCVVLLPKIDRRMPGALVGIALSGALVFLMGWHGEEMGAARIGIVKDIGEGIGRNLDLFSVPHLLFHPNPELTRELGTGAVALAILGLIEAASIARAVAASSGQRLNFTREFVGQGLGNCVGAFFLNFAGSGSFTRTAVCFQSGARTRMAAVFSALWTVLTILIFAPVANYIPAASLAGMLIVIAYSMIERHRLRLAWKSGFNSRVVLFGTLGSTLVLPLEYAIFVGVFLSIFFLLKITGRADLTQLVPRPDAGFDEVPFDRAAPSPIVTVNMEGDLYFAAVEDLDYELQRVLTPKTRVVILRMKRLRAVGSSAIAVLEHFYEVLRKRNVSLVVCGIEPDLVEVMTSSGLRRVIGEPNIFYADSKLFQSTELAMARALSIAEMERRRERAAAGGAERRAEAAGLVARDVMTRHCIRFGQEHQLREAIWLVSEMNRRRKTAEDQPLFLQDREGKLAGELSTWRLLREMAAGKAAAELCRMDDAELARHMSDRFQTPIHDLARRDVSSFAMETPLSVLLRKSVAEDRRVLPVCDEGGRLVGLVRESDLLIAVGKVLRVAAVEQAPTAITQR